MFKNYPVDTIAVNIKAQIEDILHTIWESCLFCRSMRYTLWHKSRFLKEQCRSFLQIFTVFLMFILNQEGGALNEQQIGDDDVKAMLKYNNIDNKYMKKGNEEKE